MMKAEQLWDKSNGPHFTKAEFLAALKEYGEAVRKRDAQLCLESNVSIRNTMAYIGDINNDCAAAIDREPLP